MCRIITSGVAALCLIAAAGAAQAGTLLALDNGTDNLVSIDTNSLFVTTVGPLGTDANFAGLAFDPNTDTVFMIGGRGNRNLFTVDQGTGASTLVGFHGINDLFGLAFDSLNNVLYGTQFAGGSGLFTLAVNNGTATTINSSMSASIGGLAYDSTNDRLVGMEDGAGDLFEINRSTGAQTLLVDGAFVNDSGLAYDPDLDLFWDIDFSGNLFSYDPNNSFARTTHRTGLGSFDGLTYLAEASNQGNNNVPEPGTLVLLGVGLLGLGAIRRRRKAA